MSVLRRVGREPAQPLPPLLDVAGHPGVLHPPRPEQGDRRLPGDEVLEQIQGRRVGPVQVVEDQRQPCLQQPLDRDEHLPLVWIRARLVIELWQQAGERGSEERRTSGQQRLDALSVIHG